jgi:hypothetical protein
LLFFNSRRLLVQNHNDLSTFGAKCRSGAKPIIIFYFRVIFYVINSFHFNPTIIANLSY